MGWFAGTIGKRPSKRAVNVSTESDLQAAELLDPRALKSEEGEAAAFCELGGCGWQVRSSRVA